MNQNKEAESLTFWRGSEVSQGMVEDVYKASGSAVEGLCWVYTGSVASVGWSMGSLGSLGCNIITSYKRLCAPPKTLNPNPNPPPLLPHNGISRKHKGLEPSDLGHHETRLKR